MCGSSNCACTRLVPVPGGGGAGGLLETSPGHLGPATGTETDVSGLRDTGQTTPRVEVVADLVEVRPDGTTTTGSFAPQASSLDHTGPDPIDSVNVERSIYTDIGNVLAIEGPSPRAGMRVESTPPTGPVLHGVIQTKRSGDPDDPGGVVTEAMVIADDLSVFATSMTTVREGPGGEASNALETGEPFTGRRVAVRQKITPVPGGELWQRITLTEPAVGSQIFDQYEITPTTNVHGFVSSRAGSADVRLETEIVDGVQSRFELGVGGGFEGLVGVYADTITGRKSVRLKAGPGVGTDRDLRVTETSADPEISVTIGDFAANATPGASPGVGAAFGLVLTEDVDGNVVVRYAPLAQNVATGNWEYVL